jgi:hypothetical protein
MTSRDRIVLTVVATLVILGAAWFMLVAPEREKASKLDTKITAASAALSTAEGELANARGAEARYSTAYASIVSLGKAVPPGEEVPSLVYQLDQASNQKHVEFSSVASGAAGSSGGAGAAGGPSATPAASVTPAAFTQMPFTFVFNGSFFDLYHLFQQLNRFTERTPSGVLQISGRLLTIQSVKLAQASGSGNEASKEGLSGTITATAYVLPPSQGLTAGATSTGPAGAGSQASTTSSPTTTPAIARVTP